MALAEISFFSQSLDMTSRMNVLLPDASDGRKNWPVFYLLHGLSSDSTTWLRKTSIERYAADIPLIVVMPETARGWYTNAASRPADGFAGSYEDHFIHDVVPFVDRIFPTVARREGRVIGGLSMGGYGAIKLALKFPDMFCSANSHSGVVMTPMHKPGESDWQKRRIAEFQQVFGPDWQGGPNDPVALARKCPLHLRPALRLDCGTGDFLLEQNREFHTQLQSLHFPHEYQEFEGDHTWAYWDLHVQDALAFHRRQLHI